MTITELSIKRPTLIVVIFSALTVLGLYSYTQLNYELLPKISPPMMTITTIYPGASPNEVESSVTKPIEDAVSSIENIESVNSTSKEGVSFIFLQLKQSANVDIALQEAQRKVNKILATLPSEVKTPSFSKFALDEVPIIRMGVTSNLPDTKFYQFVKDKIKPMLAKLSGVGEIILVGGKEREIKVNLNLNKINSLGLSIIQITQAIKTSNLDFPTGKIKDRSDQYVVRVAGKFKSLNQLRNLVVATTKDGSEIRLSDIAEIEDGSREQTSINRINGMSSLGILVQKQTDANAVMVSELIRKELSALEKNYKESNLKFDIAQDNTEFTVDAVNGVKLDLGLAVILVALVMLLFLHSIRDSFIVFLAIPASLISTLIVMYGLGFTFNLMTLLALSLVVGILVDDSIVVLENIHHHLEKGESKRVAALKGRNEIGFAALAITLVDVVVFVPLALTGGMIGNILRQFAIVVLISTLMSLFVSFTVTPLLASRIGKLQKMNGKTFFGRFNNKFEKVFHNTIGHYIVILKWGLANKWKVIVIALVLFIGSISLIPLGFIESEFITQSDRGEFAVILEGPLGATLDNTNFITQKVEKFIANLPGVEKEFVTVGASNEGLVGQTSNNSSEIDVSLIPKEKRKKSTEQIGEEIRVFAQSIPGVKVRVNPIGLFGTANRTPIQLFVNGTNRKDVRKGASILKNLLNNIPGTADVRLSSEKGRPETRVEIDRRKLAKFNLSIAEVGAELRIALTGDDDSKFRDGNDDYNIRIVLDQYNRSKISDLRRLTFTNRLGQHIELQQFARVYQSTGPTKLERRNRVSSVTVFSQVNGRASGSIGEDVKKALEKGIMPQGVNVAFEGDLKMQSDSFSSLGLAMIAAIIFVFLVMIALYDSYYDPFIILFSIPVALVGALLTLALLMKTLSIFSILGIIMLVGLVDKNAILLVDRTNQLRRENHLSLYDSLIEAGKSRIRPIVMTTTAMVFGMLPMALATDAGSEWKSSLAWAIIGGLLSSMFLTLILVPVMYELVEDWINKIKAFFSKRITKSADNIDVELESN